jgi:hypothetical protein
MTILFKSFGIDIFLTFFTNYIDNKGFKQNSHKVIACNYITGYFVVDFLSAFPL